jgi:ABC-2 type transport system ATP-binding protein
VSALAVEALGVERRHRGGRGVGPLDLRVEPGEVVAVMGPNGAGKTTLLRVLATLDRPAGGVVRWWDGGATQARRSLGLALDSAVEEPTLSGLQATHFWCRQWVGERRRAGEMCEAALQRFGLWEVRHEPVCAYSYGMRRRLALAQALVHEPALALLDEPTAGLDPAGVEALVAELRRRSDAALATVVASNDPNFAAAAAHRVAFLSAGRLLRCAPPAELLAAVRAARIAELSVATGEAALDLEALRRVAGVEKVEPRPLGGALVHFHDPAALPGIVAVADHPGGRLRAVRLHEPDLRDAFRELTGLELVEGEGR